jgi:hypothetical protein
LVAPLVERFSAASAPTVRSWRSSVMPSNGNAPRRPLFGRRDQLLCLRYEKGPGLSGPFRLESAASVAAAVKRVCQIPPGDLTSHLFPRPFATNRHRSSRLPAPRRPSSRVDGPMTETAADEKFIDWAAEVDLRCVPADDHVA